MSKQLKGNTKKGDSLIEKTVKRMEKEKRSLTDKKSIANKQIKLKKAELDKTSKQLAIKIEELTLAYATIEVGLKRSLEELGTIVTQTTLDIKELDDDITGMKKLL